jgi:phosphatidate cytidylyltransferase
MMRMVTGLLLGGGWLLLLLYGPFFLFGLAICGAGAIGLYEYFRMNLGEGEKRFLGLGVLLGLIPLVAALGGRIEFVAAALFLSMLFLVIAVLQIFSILRNGFEFICRLTFGVVYIGFFLAHIILIRGQPQGISWLLVLSVCIAVSDTGAYYTGSWFGKRKLIPSVSPGKTWVGAAGGLVAGGLAAVLTAGFLFQNIDMLRVTVSGLCLVCIGMIGDLVESMIKRSAGVKDSGRWLTGHGGLLDRGDSLLITAPALFYLLYYGVLSGT